MNPYEEIGTMRLLIPKLHEKIAKLRAENERLRMYIRTYLPPGQADQILGDKADVVANSPTGEHG